MRGGPLDHYHIWSHLHSFTPLREHSRADIRLRRMKGIDGRGRRPMP